MSGPYISTGITVSFGAMSGELLDVNHAGQTADAVDVTHQQSVNQWREFLAGLKDAGEITLTMHRFTGTAPTTGQQTTLSMTWPSGAGGFSCDAIASNTHGLNGPLGDKISGDLTFKLSGEPAWT